MAAKSITIDGVKFRAVKNGVKAATELKQGAYFQDADLESITSKYRKLITQAMDHFEPRFRSFPGSLPEALLKELTEYVTLYAMFLDHVVGSPIRVSKRDWDSWALQCHVYHLVKNTWPRNKEKAAAVTAQLLGLSKEGFAHWQEGLERSMEYR
ncbi:hypothetical protein K1X84_15085 [bacterium]|nr:hypothetical protein [bacterium]